MGALVRFASKRDSTASVSGSPTAISSAGDSDMGAQPPVQGALEGGKRSKSERGGDEDGEIGASFVLGDA